MVTFHGEAHTKLEILHKKQKHAARIIHFQSKFHHSQPLLINMKALNMFQLNLYKHSCFMYQIQKGLTPKAFQNVFTITNNKYSTRSCGSFYKPFYRMSSSRFAISYRGPSIWNKVSTFKPLLQVKSYQEFKTLVKTNILAFSLDEVLNLFWMFIPLDIHV